MTSASETPKAVRGDVYQIRIKGQLGAQWSDWFEGFSIIPAASDDTLLSGPVTDQAALHGLLRKVRDLGLPLLSVIRLDTGQAESQLPEPLTNLSNQTKGKDP